MSRSAAARADRDHTARVPRTVPRRVSGPVRGSRMVGEPGGPAIAETLLAPRALPRVPSRPPLRLAAAGGAVALRVAEAAMEVSGSRTMDRLVRSRAWVVIVAFGLIGIVAMQVSLLKLNSGIGRAVETAATLERANATLRGEVSRLSSGDRVQALAGSRGYVMPEPADVTFLRAGSLRSDGARAARRMRAPDPATAGPAGSPLTPSSVTFAPTGTAAPAAAETAATAPAATAPAVATPAPAATAPAPATAAPVQPATAAAAAPAAAATTATGGVTVP